MNYIYEIHGGLYVVEYLQMPLRLQHLVCQWKIEILLIKDSNEFQSSSFKRTKKWLIQNHPELLI